MSQTAVYSLHKSSTRAVSTLTYFYAPMQKKKKRSLYCVIMDPFPSIFNVLSPSSSATLPFEIVLLNKPSIFFLKKNMKQPQYLEQKALSWGVDFEVIAQLTFALPATYKFHTKKSMDIEVDLIRLAQRATGWRNGKFSGESPTTAGCTTSIINSTIIFTSAGMQVLLVLFIVLLSRFLYILRSTSTSNGVFTITSTSTHL